MGAPTSANPTPLRNSYWVIPGKVLAGEHPGGPNREATREKLRRLIDAGVECFIDLTEPNEIKAYDRELPFSIEYLRKPIKDHSTPAQRVHMAEILDCMHDALQSGRCVYVHCRAGIGRTGTVIGCFLVERGLPGESALDELNRLWQQCERSHSWASVPETSDQTNYVLRWKRRGIFDDRGGLTTPDLTSSDDEDDLRSGSGPAPWAHLLGNGQSNSSAPRPTSKSPRPPASGGATAVANAARAAVRESGGEDLLTDPTSVSKLPEAEKSRPGVPGWIGSNSATAAASPAPNASPASTAGSHASAAGSSRTGNAPPMGRSGAHPANGSGSRGGAGGRSDLTVPAGPRPMGPTPTGANGAPESTGQLAGMGGAAASSAPAAKPHGARSGARGGPRATGSDSHASTGAPTGSLSIGPVPSGLAPTGSVAPGSVPPEPMPSGPGLFGSGPPGTVPPESAAPRASPLASVPSGPAPSGTVPPESAAPRASPLGSVPSGPAPSGTAPPQAARAGAVPAGRGSTTPSGKATPTGSPASSRPSNSGTFRAIEDDADPLLDPEALAAASNLRGRFLGALIGLATGDAVAAATQYRRPGSFTPVGDLLGGGPFDLPRGGWSDDTAMTLCLADSLLDRNGFDARDQMERYRRWQQEGYLSATGQCVGITASTARAIAMAQWRRQALFGSHDPSQQDPEPLSRVAAAVLFFFATSGEAINQATEAARTTCQAPAVLEACRALARALYAALTGQPKATVLEKAALTITTPAVAAITGSNASTTSDGSGPVAAQRVGTSAPAALAAAIAAFGATDNFRDAILYAANLGGDSDVVAAVCGQLAGAYYSVKAIPTSWYNGLMQKELIIGYADRLLAHAMESLSG